MLIDELRARIKGECLDSLSVLKQYQIDKSQLGGVLPKYVIYPECSDDIKYILDFANQTGIPITGWGAGSGKSGGSIPEKNGIVLSFEKMNQILEMDVANRLIVVQPGVVLEDIKEVVLSKGLYYPPDPASSDWCTIGGCVAENAGGPCSLKYGVTADYVLGLEGYFGNGDFFSLGGKCHKNVAGYDLLSLLIGQEGTLALITKITLKLIPRPLYEDSFWCSFRSVYDATKFLSDMCQSSCHFSAVEFLDSICLKAVKSSFTQDKPWLNHVGVLLKYDSDTQEGVFRALKLTQQYCNQYAGQLYTNDPLDFWNVRKGVSEALSTYSICKRSEDITVPPDSIHQFLVFLDNISTESVICLGYGHLGDGNIHTNILNMNLSDLEWQEQKNVFIEKIIKYALTLGGTLSGEHGIGLTKKAYMPLYFSEIEINIMKQIKAILDPNNILNPSKMF